MAVKRAFGIFTKNSKYHLSFNISHARSTAILVLDYMKFQYCFFQESPLFEPLNERIKQGLI